MKYTASAPCLMSTRSSTSVILSFLSGAEQLRVTQVESSQIFSDLHFEERPIATIKTIPKLSAIATSSHKSYVKMSVTSHYTSPTHSLNVTHALYLSDGS